MVETAVREVWEETGWHLRPETLELLGWLHIHHLRPCPQGHPLGRFPWPDIVQLVFTGEASDREEHPVGDWTDTDGCERASNLLDLSDAAKLIDDREALPFLDLVAQRRETRSC